MMEARTCLQCGHIFYESGGFCPDCGTAQSRICPDCGGKNGFEASYCSQCGVNLSKRMDNKSARRQKKHASGVAGEKAWLLAAAGVVIILSVIWYAAFMDTARAPRAAAGTGSRTAINPDMRGALEKLQAQLNQDPSNVKTWIQLGNLYYDTGNFEESIFHYHHALLMDSTNADVRVDLAIGYFNTGQPERAVMEMKKTLEMNPNHHNAHYNLGVVLNSMGEYEEARFYWEKYLSFHPAGDLAERIRSAMADWK